MASRSIISHFVSRSEYESLEDDPFDSMTNVSFALGDIQDVSIVAPRCVFCDSCSGRWDDRYLVQSGSFFL